MKPYQNPDTISKRRFNHRLSGIRTLCTENLIALWKLRFQCLRRGIGTKIRLAANIVLACGILHNMCILWSEPDPNDEDENEDDDDDDNEVGQNPPQSQTAIRAAGQVKRDFLSQNFC